MRDLAYNFIQAAESGTVSPFILAHLDFMEDPLYAWTGLGSINYAGHIYHGIGGFGDIGTVEEYSEPRAGTQTLTLTHVPNKLLSSIHNLTFKGRAYSMALAFFDAAGDLIGVEPLTSGTIETLTIKRRPDTSTIEARVTNELAILKKTWGHTLTDADHQKLNPGDTALRFVASLQDLKISF